MIDPIEQSLREMKKKDGFYIGNNALITFSDLQGMFSVIEDEIGSMYYNLSEMFLMRILRTEPPVLRETQQENLERYKRAYNLVLDSFNSVSLIISEFDKYLQQERKPSKMFSLQQKNDDTEVFIEAVDKRVKNYLFYAEKETLPSLDEAISLFYNVIEKYNSYIEIFNQRNVWAHENIPSCFNQKVPMIVQLENLKNWSPK